MLLKAFEGGEGQWEEPGVGDASCLLQVHLPAKANAIFSLNVVLVVVAAAFRALYTSRSQTTPTPPSKPHPMLSSFAFWSRRRRHNFSPVFTVLGLQLMQKFCYEFRPQKVGNIFVWSLDRVPNEVEQTKHMRRGLKLPQKCAVKLFRKISKEKDEEKEGEKEKRARRLKLLSCG